MPNPSSKAPDPRDPQSLARVRTIVDGYNLLFVSGVMGKIDSGESLEDARHRLLAHMADRLTEGEADRCVVVFDASKKHRSDASESVRHGPFWVLVAKNHAEADDLIEELISAHPYPKKLTVVSGDRRIRVAARKRRVKDYDSDAWWSNLEVARRGQGRGKTLDDIHADEKPNMEDDDTNWLEIFKHD